LSVDELIQIQVEFGRGSWRTLRTVINNDQYIAHAMQAVSNINPNKRIRAVDSIGRLINFI